MSNIRRSLALAAIDSYVGLALQLGSTAIIARVLTPEQAGIFAVAAVFTALASTFRDFGVAEFLIQKEELTVNNIRASLAVNILTSWSMGALIFFSAPFASEFYRSDGVAEIMRFQALNFILIPFGAVTMACFRRDLNFLPITIASISANFSSFVVAIGAALLGFGYMSLAWASLAGVAVTVAVSISFQPKGFPRWPGITGAAEVINFGKFASGIYIFGQLSKGAPELIIGRTQGLSDVAIFGRGTGLIEIFNRLVLRAILPVCLPYFAKSARGDGGILKGYLTSVSYLTAIGWPIIVFLGLTAFSAIRIVYGPQWLLAVPLAQICCIATAITLLYQLAKEALLAQGQAKESNKLQLGMVGAQIIGLCAVVPFGLIGAAVGLLLASVVGAILSHFALRNLLGLRVSDVLHTCLPSIYITIISSAPVVTWTLFEKISESNFLRFEVVGGLLTLVFWLIALRVLNHPLHGEVVKLINLLKTRFL